MTWRQNMNIDPNLTNTAPPAGRNHMFFTLCYHDSASARVLCICYPPGTSASGALQAELAQRNLYGTPVWHYPTDSHEEVSGLEELDTIPEALRETLLGLHLEDPEPESEDDDQLAVANRTTPEEDDQAKAENGREEILYDSDEPADYVRTPVRTRRTDRGRERDAAEEPGEQNLPNDRLLRRDRVRSGNGRQRELEGAPTHASAYESALRLLNPALFAEPDRQRAQFAVERNEKTNLPHERLSRSGSLIASGYGKTAPAGASTRASAYEGALRLLDPALFAKPRSPQAVSAACKRKTTPVQQRGGGNQRFRFSDSTRGKRDSDEEEADYQEEVREHEGIENDNDPEVAPSAAREVIEIGSSQSDESSEEEAAPA
ncbi:hypothetical protein B0A48_11779 [Cryoendolithus antarcticus]|uniref:Uncharacterized protein n=1 Tax=Cryoendolithus antarcticus TaxID=1507870 RepID=A0A1V8SSQ8_9PEZI|nr:hypothetical protein B0A48_11779 [Cryoendolithus antarcticus]